MDIATANSVATVKNEYFAMQILDKNKKSIGYHNGYKLVKRRGFFAICFINMLVDELLDACAVNGYELVLIQKEN